MLVLPQKDVFGIGQRLPMAKGFHSLLDCLGIVVLSCWPVAGRWPVSRWPVAGGRWPVAGEPVSRWPVSRWPVAGEPVSRWPVAGEPVSRWPVAGEQVSR